MTEPIGGFDPTGEGDAHPEPVNVPMIAIGNAEPLPDRLPEALKEMLRPSRAAAGYCDHGQQLNLCEHGCVA